MKTSFLSIVFLVMLIAASAQEKATINFSSKKHDFGKIYQNKDSVTTATFYFENTGEAPLAVQKVTTSCGCTATEWTKAPVEKNQKGFIKVTFNSKEISGKFSKSIFVKSSAENDVVVLKIEGEVLSKKEKSFWDIFN